MSVRKPKRLQLRLIDRLPKNLVGVWVTNPRVSPEARADIEKHWETLEGKADFAHVYTHRAEVEAILAKEGSSLKESKWSKWPRFSKAEIAAMLTVLTDLMEPLDSDSARREWRDRQLAVDYLFHKEVLKHDIVMPSLCARWGVTRAAARQAIKREKAEAQLARESAPHPPGCSRDVGAIIVTARR